MQNKNRDNPIMMEGKRHQRHGQDLKGALVFGANKHKGFIIFHSLFTGNSEITDIRSLRLRIPNQILPI